MDPTAPDLEAIEARRVLASAQCERKAGDPACELIHSDVSALVNHVRALRFVVQAQEALIADLREQHKQDQRVLRECDAFLED